MTGLPTSPARSILEDPGTSEAIDALVAAAPTATPEQVELVNRLFRSSPDAPAGVSPRAGGGHRSSA